MFTEFIISLKNATNVFSLLPRRRRNLSRKAIFIFNQEINQINDIPKRKARTANYEPCNAIKIITEITFFNNTLRCVYVSLPQHR